MMTTPPFLLVQIVMIHPLFVTKISDDYIAFFLLKIVMTKPLFC